MTDEIQQIRYEVADGGKLEMPDWALLDVERYDAEVAEAQRRSDEAVVKAHSWGVWAINHAWVVGQALVRAKERAIHKGRELLVCPGEGCGSKFLDRGELKKGEECPQCGATLAGVDLTFVDYCEAVTGKSHKTASKYMALARANQTRPPLELAGLTNALHAAALLPETPSNKVPPEERARQSYLSGIMTIERWWDDGKIVKKLQPQQKQAIRKQLEPLVKIYRELGD